MEILLSGVCCSVLHHVLRNDLCSLLECFCSRYFGILYILYFHYIISALMMNAIISLKILNYRLENFTKNSELHFKHNAEHEICVLRKRMKEYFKLMKYVKELSHLLGGSVFIDFIIFSTLLTALLYQTSRVCIDLFCYATLI